MAAETQTANTSSLLNSLTKKEPKLGSFNDVVKTQKSVAKQVTSRFTLRRESNGITQSKKKDDKGEL